LTNDLFVQLQLVVLFKSLFLIKKATMESLLSGALCGILYGLFSGQPLTILGSTGPVLIFETILFAFCQ